MSAIEDVWRVPPESDEPSRWGDPDEALTGFAACVLTRDQLRAIPPVRPAIAEVLSLPSAAVLVGSYGIGKTFVTLSMGLSIANGIPWVGQAVERMPVLYVVGEGAHGLDQRIRAWEYAWNSSTVTSDEWFRVAVKPASLKQRSTWQQMADWARDGGYRMVILDTFSSLGPDVDETRDAPQVMRWLSDLAVHLDGVALLVHHPGWSDASRTRGGYQLEGNADEVMVLTGTPTDAVITLEVKKRKDGPGGHRFWLRREPVEAVGSLIIEATNLKDRSAPMRERIRLVLENYGSEGVTATHLMDELGVDPKQRSHFYAVIRDMRADGEIAKQDAKRGARYWLPDQVPPGVEVER